MRKLLSAGVLALAAAGAVMLPASAQASPAFYGSGAEETEWTYYDDYFHEIDCKEAGEAGLALGEWEAYDCRFVVIPADWDLYVMVDDDDDDHDDDEDEGDEGDDD